MRNCSFTVTPKLVKDKLIKLKMSKAPGIDLVGSRMLSEISEEISDIVAELYKSLTAGDVPQDWKLASVTAVYKKAKKTSPSNYRPISLTINLCKLFESIVKRQND